MAAFRRLGGCALEGRRLGAFLLIAMDCVYIALHVLHETGWGGAEQYSLMHDHGFAEFYQITKEFWIVLGLAYLAWSARQALWFVLCLGFGYVLADDLFQVHEHIGIALAQRPWFPLRNEDAIESGWLVLGVAGLFAVGYLVCRRSDRDSQRATRMLAPLVLLLALFSIGVDAVEAVLRKTWHWNAILTVVEDGGELVVTSLIAATVLPFAFVEAACRRRSRASSSEDARNVPPPDPESAKNPPRYSRR